MALLLMNRGVWTEFRWVWFAFPRPQGPWLLLWTLLWAPALRAFRWVVVSRVMMIRRTRGIPIRMLKTLVGSLIELVPLFPGEAMLTAATLLLFL